MTNNGDLARSPISQALSADFISMSKPARALGAALLQAWNWVIRNSRGVLASGVARRLKIAETVSLGEKRFVSILQVDGEQFLVGGSQSNVVLLAKLEAKPEAFGAGSFAGLLSRVGSGVGGDEADSKSSVRVTR
jgi:hypothetical protein